VGSHVAPHVASTRRDCSGANWDDEDVVLQEQPRTAVFLNEDAAVVVRQQNWPEDDSIVLIQPQNAIRFVLAVLAAAGHDDIELIRSLRGGGYEDVEFSEPPRPRERQDSGFIDAVRTERPDLDIDSALADFDRKMGAKDSTAAERQRRRREKRDGVTSTVTGRDIDRDTVTTAPALHRARTTIQKARAEVTDRKSKLTLPAPDKTDTAGAIRRQEIRQFLRDMKPEQQTKFFGSQEGKLPAEILTAVLEMPPEFSGVPNTRHALLMEEAIKAQHGPEAAEIAQVEEAITVAESAVETGRDEMRLEVGAHDKREFERQAAEIEAQHRPVWLRKKGELTKVVDLDRGIERDATPADLENGAFYADHDQYLARGGSHDDDVDDRAEGHGASIGERPERCRRGRL
jgi:hypothetical protein